MIYKVPRSEYTGKLEDYPLKNYPDYCPGKTPDTVALEKIGYLDEVERIWGRKLGGGQGIGKLREVGLIRPTEHDSNPLFYQDSRYFMMRSHMPDLATLQKAWEDYGNILEENGVKVNWLEAKETFGAYGPMRKLFMGAYCLVLKGGAIISRQGQASTQRGLERNFQQWFTELDVPILHSVHGYGICEVGAFVPVAEDVIVGFRSCACNEDGLEQVLAVFERNGVKETHIANMTTIYQDFESGGEFHTDMIIAAVAHKKVLIYPAHLDYNTFRWLRDKGFEIIEIPHEEQIAYSPGNLVILEPGKVIMPAGAKETIKRVRNAGVEVIEFDTSGLQGGMNGPRCVTMFISRDPGPGLED